jgi:hypothetical protein
MPVLIEGYVACRGCQLKSVAVENRSCELEVGIFQVEASWFIEGSCTTGARLVEERSRGRIWLSLRQRFE